jgi:DNA polymerase (family 10)
VDDLREHAESIRQANERSEIEVLAGTDVDILKDGSLDYPDDVLAELDWVIAAVHTGFDLAPDRQTARIVRAIRHPEVDVLAHPTDESLSAWASVWWRVNMGWR